MKRRMAFAAFLALGAASGAAGQGLGPVRHVIPLKSQRNELRRIDEALAKIRSDLGDCLAEIGSTLNLPADAKLDRDPERPYECILQK